MDKIKLTEMPDSRDFYIPLLLALHNLGGSSSKDEAVDGAFAFFDIDEKLFEPTTKGGDPIIINRIAFSRQQLNFAGYIDNSVYGIWALTSKAKAIIPTLIEISDVEKKKFIDEVEAKFKAEQKRRRKLKQKQEATKMTGAELSTVNLTGAELSNDRFLFFSKSSEELAEEKALEDLQSIKQMDPYAFERLCALLFKTVGYKDVGVTQKSGDGGFDGFGYISFGLVRFKVAFEAKRHAAGAIGPDKIRQFFGTMQRIKAEKGVFITTSDFSKDAKSEATDFGIELINGQQLIQLLQEHEIGYSKSKPRYDYTIDKDYFKDL